MAAGRAAVASAHAAWGLGAGGHVGSEDVVGVAIEVLAGPSHRDTDQVEPVVNKSLLPEVLREEPARAGVGTLLVSAAAASGKERHTGSYQGHRRHSPSPRFRHAHILVHVSPVARKRSCR